MSELDCVRLQVEQNLHESLTVRVHEVIVIWEADEIAFEFDTLTICLVHL